jgi:hypothetical protein
MRDSSQQQSSHGVCKTLFYSKHIVFLIHLKKSIVVLALLWQVQRKRSQNKLPEASTTKQPKKVATKRIEKTLLAIQAEKDCKKRSEECASQERVTSATVSLSLSR